MIYFSTTSEAIAWLRERCTGSMHSDSRDIQAGDGFMAWPGTVHDARQFVQPALNRGARACLMEANNIQGYADQPWFASDAVACLPDLQAATGTVASALAHHPTERLKVIAVTGTNGKTSTANWIAEALSMQIAQTSLPCGVVGTLGLTFQGKHQTTGMTTPDPVVLQSFFARIAQAGATHCAIEASSIGLQEHRLTGTQISVAVFTNFTQDHLDFHGDMASYWAAKRSLFAWPQLEHAVINLDDDKSADLLQLLHESCAQVWTYSAKSEHHTPSSDNPTRQGGQGSAKHLCAQNIHYDTRGLAFDVRENGCQHTLCTNLVGGFNVSNLLAVIAVLRSQGISLEQAVRACEQLSSVPGRMNSLSLPHQPMIVVDYSHTPDALEKALSTLQSMAKQRQGQLQVIFGCGGDRDRSKRPLMGQIAQRLANQVWVTSDNPRTEDPLRIIDDIVHNLTAAPSLQIEANRAAVIAQCIAKASPQDVILIAGKGHEDYQEVNGVKLPFSDMQQAQIALQQRIDGAKP